MLPPLAAPQLAPSTACTAFKGARTSASSSLDSSSAGVLSAGVGCVCMNGPGSEMLASVVNRQQSTQLAQTSSGSEQERRAVQAAPPKQCCLARVREAGLCSSCKSPLTLSPFPKPYANASKMGPPQHTHTQARAQVHACTRSSHSQTIRHKGDTGGTSSRHQQQPLTRPLHARQALLHHFHRRPHLLAGRRGNV